MITTLNKIRRHGPCREGWEKLLRHLGKTQADDEPLAITTILKSNGLDDALWCLRAVEARDRETRLYAVWAARQVQHLMIDPRSVAALDIAERYARGRASDDEVNEARAAARAGTNVATWAAGWAAAWAAAWTAAREAANAAREAARDAARAERQAGIAKATQAAELRRICQEIEAGRDPYPEEDGR